MAGTIPVATLREPLFHICRDSDENPVPSGQTYKTDDFYFINLAPSMGTTFTHLGSKA